MPPNDSWGHFLRRARQIMPARVLHHLLHGPRGPSTCTAPHPTVRLPSIDLPDESPSLRRPCHAGSAPDNFCCNPGRVASPPERGQGPRLATSPPGQRQCPDELASPPATLAVQRLFPSEVPDKRSLFQGEGKIQAGPRCVVSILMAPLPPTRRERSTCRVPFPSSTTSKMEGRYAGDWASPLLSSRWTSSSVERSREKGMTSGFHMLLFLGMDLLKSIDGHMARGPWARPMARNFGPAQE